MLTSLCGRRRHDSVEMKEGKNERNIKLKVINAAFTDIIVNLGSIFHHRCQILLLRVYYSCEIVKITVVGETLRHQSHHLI